MINFLLHATAAMTVCVLLLLQNCNLLVFRAANFDFSSLFRGGNAMMIDLLLLDRKSAAAVFIIIVFSH